MKARLKRTAAAAAAVLIMLSLAAGLRSDMSLYASAAATQQSVDSLRGKISSLTKEKKSLEGEMSALEEERKTLLRQKDALDREAALTEQEIDASEQLIEELETLISEKTEELDKACAEEEAQYEAYKLRLRTMYEQGEMSYLEVLLDSGSFSDMLSRIEIISRITGHDKDMSERLAEARADIETAKSDLENDKSEQETLKASLEKTKADLEARIAESDRLGEQLDKDTEDAKKALAEMEAEEEALQKRLKAEVAELSKKNTTYVGGTMTWPLPGYTTITSPFGYRLHPTLKVYKLHTGIDIRAPKGTKILAANGGEVITSEYSSAWGNYVVISHGGGVATLYAHMTKRLVSKGAKVEKGQNIGLVGSTGYSTGAHLHFEIIKNGKSVDPFASEFKKS